MKFHPTHTPKYLTPQISKRCIQVAGHADAVYLPVRTGSNYLRNKCAFNAKAEAQRLGGEVVFGWYVVVWDGVLVQFFGHAVVEVGEERYCVTPNSHDESRILFLADPKVTFDFDALDARLPSQALPLSQRKCVTEFIEVDQRIYHLKCKYPVTGGNVVLSATDAAEMRRLETLKERVVGEVLYYHHGDKDKCPCGSNRQFRKCCKPHMRRVFGAAT